MHAVLMLVVCLVQGVAATFGMRLKRRAHDWHMVSPQEALPQTKPDLHIKDPITLTDLPVRVPREGGDPVSAQRALPTRTIPSTVIPAEARQRVELKPRSYAHLPVPPLGSGSRSSASEMTPCMCVQSSPI